MTIGQKYSIVYRPYIEVTTDDSDLPPEAPIINKFPGSDLFSKMPIDAPYPFAVKKVPAYDYFSFYPTDATVGLMKEYDLYFVSSKSGFSVLFKSHVLVGEPNKVRRAINSVTLTFLIKLNDPNIYKKFSHRFVSTIEQHVYFNNFRSNIYDIGVTKTGESYNPLYEGEILNDFNAVTFKPTNESNGLYANTKNMTQADPRLLDLNCTELGGQFFGVLELHLNVPQMNESTNKYVINLF